MNETTKFTLREITATDLSAITTILDKVGFVEIKPLVVSALAEAKKLSKAERKNENIIMNLGISACVDIGGIILANYERCADTLIKWLADVAGMEEEAVKNLSLADFAELFFEVIRKEDFKDFFMVVSRSLFK